jgi:1-acyl-sn-glycerol-3-phosphate acyltransferase
VSYAIEQVGAWLRRGAEHGGATALVGTWGIAEALWLPVMPDVAVAVVTLSAPRRWRLRALAAVAGSLAGGAVAHRVGAAGTRPPLLLVTPRMMAAVDRWLTEEGARGVLHQPLSGVPFKVFAYGAGLAGVSSAGLLTWAGVGRGLRLLGVAWVSGRVGRGIARRRSPAAQLAATATTVIGFAIGLRAVVRRWT